MFRWTYLVFFVVVEAWRLSGEIPATDTSSSIVPYTGFKTELLETYATEAEAKYAMESKYGFSLKLTGT
jgi:hypothetical protein